MSTACRSLIKRCDDATRDQARKIPRCEICSAPFGPFREGEWAHLITRGNKRLRHDRRNWARICAEDHRRAHGPGGREWFKAQWDQMKGAGTAEALEVESNDVAPIRESDWREILKQLRGEGKA